MFEQLINYQPPRPSVHEGAIFGRLTVVSMKRDAKYRVLCRCECGTEKYIRPFCLVDGVTKSCGCWAQEHGRRMLKLANAARRKDRQ